MKWPRRKPKVDGMRPNHVILDEVHEYSSLDRLDGLRRQVIPEHERGWKDSHWYEEQYGRKP